VEQLAKAGTIYLIGLRRSFPIASYMAYALGKLGVRAILVDAVGGLASEQITFAGPQDAVLAISFTPYASETISLARAAAQKGVPIVSITDSPFSPLAQVAGPWIEISEGNFEGFRSMAATLTLAMTLTVAIAERRAQDCGAPGDRGGALLFEPVAQDRGRKTVLAVVAFQDLAILVGQLEIAAELQLVLDEIHRFARVDE